MTAEQLIAELRKLPPGIELLVGDWNEAYRDPTPLTRIDFDETSQTVTLQSP